MFLVPIILIGLFTTLFRDWLSRAWVNLTLALAGIPGKIIFRLPGGLTSVIIKIGFRFLFAFWVTPVSILLVNELMDAVLPFCPGLSGGNLNTLPPSLPDPSGPSDLALVEEAAPEEDPGTSRKRRAPEKDEWGTSREAADEIAREKIKRQLRRYFYGLIEEEPGRCNPVLVDQWKRNILSVLKKECKYSTRNFDRRELEDALISLHKGVGHSVWFDNWNALVEKKEGSAFFHQLMGELLKNRAK
uniref:Orf30 n=1 Tax=Daucus carota subsp. sativus TaxID=79200 RepID=I1TID8_DAUCS|nr:orf30 [Daucus carota subsp. sativus]AEY81168.1 orf30 [Daucus carota subsp. sativus]